MKSLSQYIKEADEAMVEEPLLGDYVGIELSEDSLLESCIIDIVEDGVVIQVDEHALRLLESSGCTLDEFARYGAVNNGPAMGFAVAEEEDFDSSLSEILNRAGLTSEDAASNDPLLDKAVGLAPVGAMDEAEYQGRNVPLGKPMQGDVKKSKVYVKGPKGNVVKVNFGDPNMRIKKSNPGRRKNFRARHNCDNPGPRWKARYWSCRAW